MALLPIKKTLRQRLIADRVAIPARIRACLKNAGTPIEQYSFRAAHAKVPRLGNFNLEAGISEMELCFTRKARFHFHRARALALPPRRLNGFLDVHAKIDQIGKDLRQELGLSHSPRSPKRQPRRIILKYHSRAQRMRGTLVRRYFVGMSRLEIESLRAIIEYDAGAVGDNAATETFVHALNHRHPVPLIIRSRNIGGVFSRTSGNWPAARLSHPHLWIIE